MAGSAGQAHVRQAELGRGAFDEVDDSVIESDRLEPGEHTRRRGHFFLGRGLRDERRQLVLCSAQDVLVGVADIQCHRRAAGYDVDQIRMQVNLAHGAHLVAPQACRHLPHEHGDSRRDESGVAAEIHGSRPRVVGLPIDGEFLPADALDAGDHADLHTLLLQNGTLFDVQFDERMRRTCRAGDRTGIADARQFVTHARSVDAHCVQNLLHGHPADEPERAHHVGSETCPFFVGEERHCERARGRPSGFLHGLDHLEAGEHAVVPVVLASGPHRVDVRTSHDRVALAHVPRTDHIAENVDRDLKLEVAHPRDDKVASGAIVVREGKSSTTATGDLADLREGLQTTEKSVPVDAQVPGERRLSHP